MKYNSLIIGLSVLALQSCTDNLVYTGTDIEVVLTGNTYQAAFTESSPVSTFNSGNQILLNASGSLQIANRILTYMEELNQYDTTDVAPMVHAVEQYNVMREDVPHTSFTNEEALMNAPDAEDGYFKVPKII